MAHLRARTPGPTEGRDSRLAEVLGALSLATDLGNGQPPETALACTLAAVRLAQRAGVETDLRRTVYWAGLLRFVGCTSTSVEEGSFGGDDLALRRALLGVDFADPADVGERVGRALAESLGPEQGAAQTVEFGRRGPELAPAVLSSHCDVAIRLAERLGMPPQVLRALDAYHERWDGSGPRRLLGETIPLAARILSVAQSAVMNARTLGAGELSELLRKRAGGLLDPWLVDISVENLPQHLPDLASRRSGSRRWRPSPAPS